MCPTPTQVEVTLTRAREFARRHGIAKTADWEAQRWCDKWAIYSQFKHELQGEYTPGTVDWDMALRRLIDVLHI